jgi:hypothetical protein
MVQVVTMGPGAGTTASAYHRGGFFFYDAGNAALVFGVRVTRLDCAQHFLFKRDMRR